MSKGQQPGNEQGPAAPPTPESNEQGPAASPAPEGNEQVAEADTSSQSNAALALSSHALFRSKVSELVRPD